MQERLFRPRLIAYRLRRLFVGHFDVEDDGDLFLLHLVYKIGDSRGAGLALRRASGESGRVVEVVFVRQITEGEAIAEDEAAAPAVGDCPAVILVEPVQLRDIGFGVLFVK